MVRRYDIFSMFVQGIKMTLALYILQSTGTAREVQ